MENKPQLKERLTLSKEDILLHMPKVGPRRFCEDIFGNVYANHEGLSSWGVYVVIGKIGSLDYRATTRNPTLLDKKIEIEPGVRTIVLLGYEDGRWELGLFRESTLYPEDCYGKPESASKFSRKIRLDHKPNMSLTERVGSIV